ncbi:MAG: smalltalk protein [Bacteroidales bacterium]|nr:smalltalk protein [Bacteroidales bacterium]
MKWSTVKQILQIIVTVITAIISAIAVQSCISRGC